MAEFNLNKEKAVNSLLYVVQILGKADMHKTFKILYFADQKHLAKYGRPILGDTYMKMEYGPVPSFIKSVVDSEIPGLEEVVAKYNRYYLNPLQMPDLEYLSETDLECLQEAIAENKDLSFDALTVKSHDFAYDNSEWAISYLDIARAVGADEKMLKYIGNQLLNEQLELR